MFPYRICKSSTSSPKMVSHAWCKQVVLTIYCSHIIGWSLCEYTVSKKIMWKFLKCTFAKQRAFIFDWPSIPLGIILPSWNGYSTGCHEIFRKLLPVNQILLLEAWLEQSADCDPRSWERVDCLNGNLMNGAVIQKPRHCSPTHSQHHQCKGQDQYLPEAGLCVISHFLLSQFDQRDRLLVSDKKKASNQSL